MRRALAVLAGTLTLAVPMGTTGTPVTAAVGPDAGGDVTVAPAPDYAAEMLGNPFDYSDAADLLTDGHATDGWAPVKGTSAPPVFGNGTVRWTMTDDGHLFPVWLTFPGALPEASDGWWNPIDLDRYQRVAVRLYASAPTAGAALDVWRCNEPLDHGACAERFIWRIEEGWNTYVFDVSALSGDAIGLQLTINQAAGIDFEMDWLRIYQPTEEIRVTGRGTVYWDRDTDPSNNTATAPGWGEVTGGVFDVGAYPPGVYHLYDSDGYGDTINVDQPPHPLIIDPDAAGGDDYATVVRGDPWDLSQPTDVAELGGVKDTQYADGRLAATNDGNDPYVRLALTTPIDASRYHLLTVTTTYDGEFDLADAAGGGTHGRVVFWRQDTGDWNFVNSKELVTFTDRTTYTYDLADPRLKATEGSSPDWGNRITYFRWDPNEDRGDRRWWLDEIRLAAEDEAAPTFEVAWTDHQHQPGTTVTIGLDSDRRGFDGATVAAGVEQRAGLNRVEIDATDLAPGSYWLWLRASDGTSTAYAYASGPLVVTPRIAGPSRVETSVALSRSAFPDGASTALLATARNFADALAGIQLATAADAPILLTEPDTLSAPVAEELARLNVDEVFLLGGTGALSAAVEDEVRATGVDVTRLSGAGRTETAVAIARTAVERWQIDGVTGFDEVLVARAYDFPDALAAGQYVVAANTPLLLVPRDRSPSADVLAFVDEIDPETVTAVGGAGALPDERLREVARGRATDRISGSNRHATAVAARDRAVARGADADQVVIASGRNFPDALSAGSVLIARGATLLTTEPTFLPEDTADALRASTVDWYRIAGGRGAVSDDVASAVGTAAN